MANIPSSAPLRAAAGLAVACCLLLLSRVLNPKASSSSSSSGGMPLRGPHIPENRSADVDQLLDHGLQSVLGHGAAASSERLALLEATMGPIFAALPKIGDGIVNQAAASYALHRFFASSKAWTFKELTPSSHGSKTHKAPLLTIKSRVPDVISDVLEAGMSNKNIGLGDLTMLAATVEDLVNGENMEVLLTAYKAYSLSLLEPLNQEQFTMVLEAYLVSLLADDVNLLDKPDAAAVHQAVKDARAANPILEDTLLWVKDLAEIVNRNGHSKHNPFTKHGDGSWDFSAMATLVEQILSGIGRTQNSDCATMKRELLELETNPQAEGTVDLKTFHTHHLAAIGVPRDQSADYLKFLSALDTRDPQHPRAVVSNYVYASAMCLSTPGVLKLCCINECNSLMEALEQQIARPAAVPQLVASVVAALPSSSVSAPRALPGSLLRGLDQIAAQHGGQVPLHSKVFARWMHRAFPAECPNPAVPGAMHAPWVGEAYVQSLNVSTGFMSSKAQTRHAYDAAASNVEDFEDGDEEDEEAAEVLKVSSPGSQAGPLRVLLRVFALIAIVVASGIGLLRHFRAVAAALGSDSKKSDDELYI